MTATLVEQQVVQVFQIEDGEHTYTVTWNRDNHTEDSPHLFYVPEFDIVDEEGEDVEKGCQVWEDLTNYIKSLN